MRQQLKSDMSVEYDDVGSGVPVVLLHAFPLSRAMWRPQREGLADAARIITPDLRGFGGTDPFRDTPSLERMADDTAELIDHLKFDKVVLGGLSMGGYVALAFARKYASRLRGLVLADTRSEADSPEAKANRDKTIAFAGAHSALEVLEQLLPKLLSDTTRREKRAVETEVREIAAAQTPAAVVAALQALRDRADSTAALSTIAVPTLVIVGNDDALTPPALAQSIAAKLPHAHLVEISDAGHLANLEAPAAFNHAVRNYLRSLP
jgi:pimeloyl-ACP methyl ester carboxylesterase